MSNGNSAWSINFWYSYRGYVNGTNTINAVFSSTGYGFDSSSGEMVYAGDHFCSIMRNTFTNFPFAMCTNEHIPNDPSWHMITVTLTHTGTISNDVMSMYQDGLLAQSTFGNGGFHDGYTTGSDIPTVRNQWFHTGSSNSGSSYEFDRARISQMSLWSRALSPADVTNLWNQGSGLNLFNVNGTGTFMGFLTLNQTSGPIGTIVKENGHGFGHNNQVTTFFDLQQLTTNPFNPMTNGTGFFNATLTIPNGFTNGLHTISAIDSSGFVGTAQFNLTGFTQANLTIGNLNFNQTNPNTLPIKFYRTDFSNSTTLLKVTYPAFYNMSCNFNFKFAETNNTYTNLSSISAGGNLLASTFKLTNSSNEVITVICTDFKTGASATDVITQTNFPMIQQIKNFRSGQYGTSGKFGALDLVTLIIIIVAMIGFNRVNEAAGVIFSIFVVGALAFFQLIAWPTVFAAAIAIIVLVAVTSHRKIPSI